MNTCFAKIRRLAVPGVLLLVAVGAAACTSGSSPSSSPSSAAADIVLVSIRVAIGWQGDGREVPGVCHTPARRC